MVFKQSGNSATLGIWYWEGYSVGVLNKICHYLRVIVFKVSKFQRDGKKRQEQVYI